MHVDTVGEASDALTLELVERYVILLDRETQRSKVLALHASVLLVTVELRDVLLCLLLELLQLDVARNALLYRHFVKVVVLHEKNVDKVHDEHDDSAP